MSARWARFRPFRPILAGARLKDRMLACTGALAAISFTAVIGVLVEGPGVLPFILAPVGASAVLVFAVPASPLAQPWPVIGGNVVSTLTGVIVDDAGGLRGMVTQTDLLVALCRALTEPA